jgi:hypothetical protein
MSVLVDFQKDAFGAIGDRSSAEGDIQWQQSSFGSKW